VSSDSTNFIPSIDNLLIIPADEINYESLSTLTLTQLATQKTDPFIATSGLGELAQRDPQKTKEAAAQILDAGIWDRHLTAFALTLLYDRDPEGAIPRMAELALTEDPKILEALIENILSDSVRFQSAPENQLARAIARRVAAIHPDAFADLEQRDKFLKLFGDKRPEST